MAKSADKKNVVVVGGGFAGVTIARALSAKLDTSKYNLILISPRAYNIHMIAGARINVDEAGKFEEQAFLPYDKLFVNGNGTKKTGVVTSISTNKEGKGGVLTLEDGETVSYHLLALTPGSVWPGPVSFPNEKAAVASHVASWRKKYSSAKEIVLVGGGAVGLETAGEIKDIYPNKKVTIVQGDELPLNSTYPPKLRKAIDEQWKARGISFVYNDYVDEFPAEGVVGVTTRNGKKLNADLVIQTTGPRPNTEFISTLGADVLTNRGFVKVKPTLQLASYSDIFAAGDVIDWKEQKQAAKAGAHAAIVATNILAAANGQTPSKNYKGSTELIIVTNGKGGGVAYVDMLWGLMFGNWFSRFAKSKDLLIGLSKTPMGY